MTPTKTLAAPASRHQTERRETVTPAMIEEPDLWTAMHEEVQFQLGQLEAKLRVMLPALRTTSGGTRGERFFLFSYRTFSTPGRDVDPVVVSITFTPAGSAVHIQADASGEEGGDVIVSVPGFETPLVKVELIKAIKEAARALAATAEAIGAALVDEKRRIGEAN